MRPHVLELMASLSGFSGPAFDPATFIRVVNTLTSAGVDSALAVMNQYAELSRSNDWRPDNALLVARGLFATAQEGVPLPDLALGAPDVEENLSLFPAFPLHVELDLPLLVVGGYRTGGEGPPPQAYLDWCAQHGTLRPGPLRPPNDPLATVDLFLRSARWRTLTTEPWHDRMLRLQAWRAVADVYPVDDTDPLRALQSLDETTWNRHRTAVQDLSVHWNSEANEYERTPSSAQ